MKPVRRHKIFEKHFRQRITPHHKLIAQFEDRFALFMQGERGYPLDDHPLYGKLKGKRAYSVAGDIRVVYLETDEEILFLDIGSHSQVYK